MRDTVRDDLAERLTQRYDRQAGAYLELWAPILERAGLRLARELAGCRVDRILDVGAGVGSLAAELRTVFPGAQVMAVDRSPGMLALGPPGLPRAVMDARQLAVRSSSVDLVLMIFMLFHLERPAEALSEARRVLRPGARLGTLTWGGELESTATRVWTECLDAHGAMPTDPDTEARHAAVDAPEKMQALLAGAGFANARSWADDLVHTIGLEPLIRLKTQVGSSQQRFESLDAPARETCLEAARRRLGHLEPEDFVARARIVYTVATA